MIEDDFRIRYKKAPLAIWVQDIAQIVEFHNHSEFEIVKIIEGSGEATINNKTFSIKQGDMLFINPFEVHSWNLDTQKPYLHKCLVFDCSLINDAKIAEDVKKEAIRITGFVDSKHPVIPTLHTLFDNIISCYENDDRYIEMEIKANISLIFACLLKNNLTDSSRGKTKNEIFCTNTLQYISEHYGENITSKDIAAALSYNQSYFCRMFKKSFNKQFNDYLNMYRIVEAKKLLCIEGKTITRIAVECGFNSQSYFAECFKRYVGVLPSEYRKKQHKM